MAPPPPSRRRWLAEHPAGPVLLYAAGWMLTIAVAAVCIGLAFALV